MNVMPASAERYAVRPLGFADALAAHEVAHHAFADLTVRLASPPWPGPSDEAEGARRGEARVRHVIETDPQGSLGAFDGDTLVGVALAIRREEMWGLSLLVVEPGYQSSGVGRSLLNAALEYAEGCDSAIILSSTDTRALRAYATSGFDLHPAAVLYGAPDRGAIPGDLRVDEPDEADLDLVDAVDRVVRGASHRADIPTLIDSGGRFLSVAEGDERGYAVVENGPKLLAATSPAVAQRLLWTSLALTDPDAVALVANLDGRQQWAFDVVLKARLVFMPTVSGVLTRGQVGPMTPYIPSGAYL